MKRVCTIKILDEVNCVFVGLHPDHIGYFYEEYSAFAPNYYFNPKYKLGTWDGKIRYFFRTGKTYVQLLDEIIPRVIQLGYKVKLVDKRNSELVHPPAITANYFHHIIEPDSGEPWEVRNYQIAMVNSLIDYGCGVGIAGTGAGKTSMCAALALKYEQAAGMRSIIIVPDKNLTEQTTSEYAFFELDVGEYSGDRKDVDHTHVVSTWQALKNNPSLIRTFQVMIIDECHGLRGHQLTKLVNEHGQHIIHRFGVTGTLPKEQTDAMAVKVAVGPVRYEIPAHVLIEQGYLAKLHIDVMQLSTNLRKQHKEYLEETEDEKPATYTQFKDSYLPEWTAEKSFLQSEKERLEWISMYIEARRDMRKGNVLCYVNGIRFGKKLAKMIDGAKFVYGKDKMKARKEIYELFKDNDNLVVIATVNIAGTGLNIKRIFNLIYIDMGKSFIRTIQAIGRGLRKAPDKDFVHVTDICSDFKYSKRHVRERMKFYKEAKYPYRKRVIEYTPTLV